MKLSITRGLMKMMALPFVQIRRWKEKRPGGTILVVLILVCSLLVLSSPESIRADERPRVLLGQIEDRHMEDQMKGIESRAEALIEDALQRSCLFHVLDRKMVDSKPSGATGEMSERAAGPEKARGAEAIQGVKEALWAGRAGEPTVLCEGSLAALRGKGVDFLITGVLTGDDLATEVSIKLIRTDTGQIEKSFKAVNITTPHIEPIIRKLLAQLKEAYPRHGKIIQVDGDKVAIDLGTLDCVETGDRFAIGLEVDGKVGEEGAANDRPDETAATIVIEKTAEKTAWGALVRSGGVGSIEIGAGVRSLLPLKKKEGSGPSPDQIITLRAFRNMSGEPALDQLGVAVADALTARLAKSKHFWVVESTQLETILDEQRLGSSSLFDPSTTVESGRLWRSRYVITGSFQNLGSSYRIDGRLIDLETSEVILAESVIGEDPGEAGTKLGDIFLGSLESGDMLKDSRITGLKVRVRAVEEAPAAIYHLLPVLSAPILTVTLKNETDQDRRVVVNAEIVGVTRKSADIVEIGPGEEIVRSVYPAMLPGKLKSLVSTGSYDLSVRVGLEDGRALHEESRTIRLLPYDALASAQDFIGRRLSLLPTIAAWVSPNIRGGAEILAEAAERNPRGAMSGYQLENVRAEWSEEESRSANEPKEQRDERCRLWTREQVKAIYDTLREKQIRYVDQSTQFPSTALQRVLLPEDVLEHKSANCIDASVLFASLLLRAGLNPILILLPDHALLGWETWDRSGEYEVLETTKLRHGDFEAALEEGRSRLRKAGLETELGRLPSRRGELRTGKGTILDIRALKETMADIPV